MLVVFIIYRIDFKGLRNAAILRHHASCLTLLLRKHYGSCGFPKLKFCF